MKTFLSLILTLTLLAGCKDESERRATTQFNAANPEVVCTMPDGRVLRRITIDRPRDDHYVYFFSTNDTTTVSVNYQVPQGKSSYTQTIVLDGVEYNLVPKK